MEHVARDGTHKVLTERTLLLTGAGVVVAEIAVARSRTGRATFADDAIAEALVTRGAQ